jgi:hypothetical protein
LPLYFGSFHFRCLEYKVHLINYSHGAETRFENIQQVIDFIIFYRVIISDKYETQWNVYEIIYTNSETNSFEVIRIQNELI